MEWFGESWGAPVCDPAHHVDTPVGRPCAGHDHLHVDRPAVIEAGDQGVAIAAAWHPNVWHLDCWLHEIGADRLGVSLHK